MSDNPIKPGCYASFLAYKEGAPECETCPFESTCGPIARERHAAYLEYLGVQPSPTRKPKAQPKESAPSGELVEALPKKVLQLMRRIDTMGISVTESFRNGANPFPKSPHFLRVISHLLLKRPEGIETKQLIQALMIKLDWTEGTATSHVAQAKRLFTTYNVIDEADGRIVLRKPV